MPVNFLLVTESSRWHASRMNSIHSAHMLTATVVNCLWRIRRMAVAARCLRRR